MTEACSKRTVASIRSKLHSPVEGVQLAEDGDGPVVGRMHHEVVEVV